MKLLQPVRIELNIFLRDELFRIQNLVQKRMRVKNNKLCREKCKEGSRIHNFTQLKVPDALSSFLKDGLNNVPQLEVSDEQVIDEVETDIKKACINIFKEAVGCYPRGISMNDSVETLIKNLLTKALNNEPLNSSLISRATPPPFLPFLSLLNKL